MAARGRKSKYDTHVKPYLKEIREWCNIMTESQICQRLGVGKSAWSEYKKNNPELQEQIKNGRQDLVSDLKSALIKKAKGYSYTETKVNTEEVEWSEEMKERLLEAGFTLQEIGQARAVKTEVRRKEMSPDVAAINLALKNYDKENWANDPQMLDIRKKELELRERQVEANEW